MISVAPRSIRIMPRVQIIEISVASPIKRAQVIEFIETGKIILGRIIPPKGGRCAWAIETSHGGERVAISGRRMEPSSSVDARSIRSIICELTGEIRKRLSASDRSQGQRGRRQATGRTAPGDRHSIPRITIEETFPHNLNLAPRSRITARNSNMEERSSRRL